MTGPADSRPENRAEAAETCAPALRGSASLHSSRSAEHEVHMTLGGKPSGLRNPSKAMRGLGAGALTLEALVLLLAIVPIKTVLHGIPTTTLMFLLITAAAAIVLTGLLRTSLGWWLGSALQVVLLAGGFLHWTIAAVGVLFGLVWIYVLHVRRTVLF